MNTGDPTLTRAIPDCLNVRSHRMRLGIVRHVSSFLSHTARRRTASGVKEPLDEYDMYSAIQIYGLRFTLFVYRIAAGGIHPGSSRGVEKEASF